MRINEYNNAELRLLVKTLKKADRIIDKKCECFRDCVWCKYHRICSDLAQLKEQIYSDSYK